jgi:FAD/FMN-containing dehydrogenase
VVARRSTTQQEARMSSVDILTLDGGSVTIDSGPLDALSDRLRGDLVATSDPGYEQARAIWNAMITKRPALIARCASADDVAACVAFAREHRLLTSVKGAGHNIAGSALCEGGMTIDLSGMRRVDLDRASGRTVVQPGATLADLDAATLPHGRAVPVGINSTTGIAGLTLGGGFGWLSRSLGMTIDCLLSADVVTADGERIRASAEENPDLHWALRGGGGNFGVVTSFEFAAHPARTEMLCGLIVHPFDGAPEALDYYRGFTAEAPEELTTWVVMRHAPPLPFLPESVHGSLVLVFALVYAGDPEAGQDRIAPLRAHGTPVGEHIGIMPFAQFQQAFDPLLTPGARNYWKSHNFGAISDGLADTLLSFVETIPSPQSEIFLAQLGGAAGRVPVDATAYPHRDSAFLVNVHTRWEDAAKDEECVSWAREFYEATAPYSTGGVYSNFVSDAEADPQIRAAYGPNYHRLVDLKRKYDPDNFFRANLNVRPND